jgi:hypothetical protein
MCLQGRFLTLLACQLGTVQSYASSPACERGPRQPAQISSMIKTRVPHSGPLRIFDSRWSGGPVLVMIRCPAHRNRQKVRWTVWGVRFGSLRLPGDSSCGVAHGVGGSMVGWPGGRHWERMVWFRWKGLPDGGGAARCGKGCGTLVL